MCDLVFISLSCRWVRGMNSEHILQSFTIQPSWDRKHSLSSIATNISCPSICFVRIILIRSEIAFSYGCSLNLFYFYITNYCYLMIVDNPTDSPLSFLDLYILNFLLFWVLFKDGYEYLSFHVECFVTFFQWR